MADDIDIAINNDKNRLDAVHDHNYSGQCWSIMVHSKQEPRIIAVYMGLIDTPLTMLMLTSHRQWNHYRARDGDKQNQQSSTDPHHVFPPFSTIHLSNTPMLASRRFISI